MARPDNTILIYDPDGNNTGYSVGLNPVSSSLKSVLKVSSIAGFAAPPPSVSGMSTLRDFLLLHYDPVAQYKALWIKEVTDPDAGVVYTENAALLNFDTSKASGFLYMPNRFSEPEDIYIAPDFSGYIFIVDSGFRFLVPVYTKGLRRGESSCYEYFKETITGLIRWKGQWSVSVY